MRAVLASVFVVALVGCGTPATEAPDYVSKIAIPSWTVEQKSDDFIEIKGDIRNDNDVPVAVIIKFVARDEAGQPTVVYETPPFGAQGISPGKSLAFSGGTMARRGTWVRETATIEVTEARPVQ